MRWWDLRREDLLALTEQAPIYVYNDESVNELFFDLLSMDALQGLYYPYGLNPHPEMLQKAFEMDASFRCNAFDEITSLRRMFPRISPAQLCLLTGSAQGEAHKRAVDSGVQVGVPISNIQNGYPELFRTGDVFAFTDNDGDPCTPPLFKKGISGLYMGLECGFFSHGQKDDKRTLFKRLLRYFPNINQLIVGNAVDVHGAAPDQKMDMPLLEELLQVIQDAFPQVRLFLEPPAAWLAYVGGLLVKVVDCSPPEAVGPTGVRLNVDPPCLASTRGLKDPRVVDGVNLSKPEEQALILSCVPSKGWRVEGGRVETGDRLFLTHMGARGPGEVRTATGRNGLPEHYLRARSMCPVKL